MQRQGVSSWHALPISTLVRLQPSGCPNQSLNLAGISAYSACVMKKSKWILIATLAVLAVMLVVGYVQFGWLFYRYQSTDCKERGKAHRARIERLERDARKVLKVGTHQEDVVRFFQENGLPVAFDKGESEYEYWGQIQTQGCAPSGCATDRAILRLSVKVDSTGTVVGDPVVHDSYRDCL